MALAASLEQFANDIWHTRGSNRCVPLLDQEEGQASRQPFPLFLVGQCEVSESQAMLSGSYCAQHQRLLEGLPWALPVSEAVPYALTIQLPLKPFLGRYDHKQ